jgi:hypothetical protein
MVGSKFNCPLVETPPATTPVEAAHCVAVAV